MLDRTIQPPVRSIDKVLIPDIVTHVFPNNIPVYYLKMGGQDVSRIDIMIEAGGWDQPKNLVSTFTNQLLKDGAGNKSSAAVAEQLDYYGAWLQLTDTYHYSYITLYTPNRFFKKVLELLELMVKEPCFPESELKVVVEQKKQRFLVDKEKVRSIALNTFTNALFGKEHPYGKLIHEKDFDKVNPDDLRAFYNNYYHSSNTKIILSGKITDEMIQCVENCFGSDAWGKSGEVSRKQYSFFTTSGYNLFVEKDDVKQNGIRLGLQTINRTNPDYHALRVMNTVLGGYFGSRLMSTIREEKGYTYGILSGITCLKSAAYFTVATQANCEFTPNVIKEVHNEIEKLQQKLVDKEELERVKNYMLGDFVRSLNGVFSLVDIYISMLAGNLPFDFYDKQIDCIHQIDSEIIRKMAQKYLNQSAFYTVIVGRK